MQKRGSTRVNLKQPQRSSSATFPAEGRSATFEKLGTRHTGELRVAGATLINLKEGSYQKPTEPELELPLISAILDASLSM